MIISSVHIKKESYWLRKNNFYQFWMLEKWSKVLAFYYSSNILR